MVSDEQIQQWADEAEAGYDVEELKRRGRGRPGRGAEPMQVVAVRLTAEELAAVDAIAERDHISRSEAIRWPASPREGPPQRSSTECSKRTLSRQPTGRSG
ncbi:MAG: ribbon-helix-helix protein, CopG family [Nocardioidaceae bacterium]